MEVSKRFFNALIHDSLFAPGRRLLSQFTDSQTDLPVRAEHVSQTLVDALAVFVIQKSALLDIEQNGQVRLLNFLNNAICQEIAGNAGQIQAFKKCVPVVDFQQ